MSHEDVVVHVYNFRGQTDVAMSKVIFGIHDNVTSLPFHFSKLCNDDFNFKNLSNFIHEF